MLSHVALFALSLAALVKSADWLIEYATRVARRLGVSDLIIGLTLTAVGTSVPELASSVSAAVQGNSGLVIGNVIGSNIANIGLIVGIAALVQPFATEEKMYARDGVILLAASTGFFALVLDNEIGRIDAVAFLLVYVAYVGFAALSDRDKIQHQFRYFLQYFVSLQYIRPLAAVLYRKRGAEDARAPAEVASPAESASRRQLLWELAAILGACGGVIVAAHFMVEEATWAARTLGVPDAVIGLSIVAIGTSLPELTVAIAAARKGNAAMVIGNVLGSNLANLLLVVGVSGSIRPLEVAEISVVYTIPIMLFFTLALLYFVKSGWRVTRPQGGLALAAYACFMVLAFLYGWS